MTLESWRPAKNALPMSDWMVVREGYLIPDMRLQIIADAWDEYKKFASQSGAMAVLRERMDDVLTEETPSTELHRANPTTADPRAVTALTKRDNDEM